MKETISGRIIDCFFTAYNEIGYGFTETIYSAALEILFRDAGLDARRRHCVDVLFRGRSVGKYRVDYLVEGRVVLELKAEPQLPPGSKAQLLTYLRVAKKDLGLLLFFGPIPEVKRVALRCM